MRGVEGLGPRAGLTLRPPLKLKVFRRAILPPLGIDFTNDAIILRMSAYTYTPILKRSLHTHGFYTYLHASMQNSEILRASTNIYTYLCLSAVSMHVKALDARLRILVDILASVSIFVQIWVL